MKPAWNKLGDEFATSATVVIGDVDCTVEKDLCGEYGVRGYPTIKYFTGSTAADGDAYEGKRDFDSLKEFADENLGPSCDAGDNIELCDEAQKALIEEAKALGAEGVGTFISEREAEIAAAEQYVKDEVQKLQTRYQELQEEKETKVKDISKPLRMYRSVKAAFKKSGHDEL
jgi:thioredoxin-like negative regulator of GroEL